MYHDNSKKETVLLQIFPTAHVYCLNAFIRKAKGFKCRAMFKYFIPLNSYIILHRLDFIPVRRLQLRPTTTSSLVECSPIDKTWHFFQENFSSSFSSFFFAARKRGGWMGGRKKRTQHARSRKISFWLFVLYQYCSGQKRVSTRKKEWETIFLHQPLYHYFHSLRVDTKTFTFDLGHYHGRTELSCFWLLKTWKLL